jgi:hypothetical protein
MIDLGKFVDEARVEDLPELAGAIEAARVRLHLRLAAPAPAPATAPAESISVAAAARLLGVSKDWIYKTPGLPFVARIGTRLVCSRLHVEKFLAARLGRHDGAR